MDRPCQFSQVSHSSVCHAAKYAQLSNDHTARFCSEPGSELSTRKKRRVEDVEAKVDVAVKEEGCAGGGQQNKAKVSGTWSAQEKEDLLALVASEGSGDCPGPPWPVKRP